MTIRGVYWNKFASRVRGEQLGFCTNACRHTTVKVLRYSLLFACRLLRKKPQIFWSFLNVVYKVMSRGSSVGIATRYGLDGPGIEFRWGRDFLHPFTPALESTQNPIKWVPDLSPGVKRPRRGADHPSPSSAAVKERVELYLYSISGPSWHVLVWNLPLPLPSV